jgi:AraC-like DNA-binding protein
VDVAFLLGFTDQSNFTRAVRRWTGKTPREYLT